MKIENFKEKLVSLCEKEYHAQPRELTANQLHCAVSKLVMEELSPVWDKSRTAHDKARKASYLSMEFLVGRAIYNNLLCLGILDSTAEELKALGVDISEFEEVEDAALGNGGLGRLAACFLDSAAALDLPLDGYGIRYKYGLFKQGIKDGFQTETADDWQRYGDPWSVRREQETVVIHFADGDVNAVPYDYPVIGYGTENVGTLRLWQAETDDEFDFDLFNRSKFTEAGEKKRAAEDISRVLYPNDETEAGKILRLKQEYFFSAAAVADLIRKHRYVTEQTFDAYLYQLVEGKQKFASQIMASKSPVRSADDIDETALSYAEIKMLATGNPYIKEKMDLDIQVQKLKLLKANYLSEKYNLEDKIIKFYPQKIAALNNTIKALEQDLATAKAHPKPSDDSFVGIEIDGKYISEKADAGKAILEFCKQMNNPDPIAIGKYRGFDMELQFSSGVVHCYEIALKGATTQKVSLGEDANGNITRIDNAIGRLSEHIENAKVELKNIQTQYETAQIEVQKPFAQEEELKAKTKRQIEVEKLISSGENEPEQNAISDYYYFSATDEQINALNNASIPFEKQTKADGSMVIRVATDDKSKAEAIMNSKNLIL